ncbi:hypothetical protein Syun_024687 [Stephania yunnanensis]|uniref:Uncharacterized protein n=1 Tax=Stephania yunnanensis TaxID=152371 RepID=A0AAP0ET80_9MAGN
MSGLEGGKRTRVEDEARDARGEEEDDARHARGEGRGRRDARRERARKRTKRDARGAGKRRRVEDDAPTREKAWKRTTRARRAGRGRGRRTRTTREDQGRGQPATATTTTKWRRDDEDDGFVQIGRTKEVEWDEKGGTSAKIWENKKWKGGCWGFVTSCEALTVTMNLGIHHPLVEFIYQELFNNGVEVVWNPPPRQHSLNIFTYHISYVWTQDDICLLLALCEAMSEAAVNFRAVEGGDDGGGRERREEVTAAAQAGSKSGGRAGG